MLTSQRRQGRRSLSSLLLAGANLCEFVMPLIRGICLARILSPEEFGLAISFTIVASVVELISDLGIAQMATRTGTEENLPTLHTLSILRGAALAVVIALVGPLFAMLTHAPGTAWVYTLFGLGSFLRSLCHLGPKISMRDYQYTPEALTVIGSQVIWTVVSIALALALHSYMSMVVGVIAYSAGAALISHLCASGRYRLGWDREMIAESFRYGRPLTLNGIALAITNLGDRFLTGSRLGLEQLAQYTALATAAFAPRSVITRFAISLFVPHFVNATGELEKRRLADVWIIMLSAIGSLFAFCYIAIGQVVVASTFGKHYTVDQTSVSLIAILACIRYMAMVPIAPSMANGRTSFVLLNTTLASTGLVLAIILLFFLLDLHVMLAAMSMGEGFGLLFVVGRLSRSIPISLSIVWTSLLVPLALLTLTATLVGMFSTSGMSFRWGLCGLGILAEMMLTIALLRRSRADLSIMVHILFPKHENSGTLATEASATVRTH